MESSFSNAVRPARLIRVSQICGRFTADSFLSLRGRGGRLRRPRQLEGVA